MNNSYEIDVVILWVDGSDEKWREKKNKHDIREHALDENRFQDWGTLKFVLRGIETFMPWVRKIHLVTEGHIPGWLKKSSKLNHITHEMFFKDKSDLPTFNSNAIELNLGWLECLSEHFILFNDDMFVLKPCEKERFFKNGLPVDFFVQSISREGHLYRILKGKPEYNEMLVNNISTINKLYVKQNIKDWQLFSKNYSLLSNLLNLFFKVQSPNKIPWINTYHHPQAHLKSTFIKIWEKEEKFRNTSKKRFRTNKDLTHWLCRFVNLIEGDFYPFEFSDHQSIYYREINDLQKIKDSTTFLCVSDDVTDEFSMLSEALAKYLSKILPKTSSFEKN
ncbi:stealth family protein [Francisella adeliensis]|uniref:Capsular biosynthesis protein n=1 Tax=Francisella adeliensis TaxID=2007306 RepID=A0A2Z4Y1W1_9GAMM|nr:stealth family protein [Francisella adeliensis]AXA34722.1 hypothetical protein CDH04_04435 [Francisella adeliensis]MBK2085598.1 Stealth CR1 domain-containing protein [Francisella adeliensis]MBK2097476.1 Stealth CR1 domain-containing protein [Francisella adeliensis]QIW12955.1 hypothetical protein FZC43_04440 [Francisella adeliensis]QIW14833.1 hypothetical protein FZC44_04440 [Francisella adeliensis]